MELIKNISERIFDFIDPRRQSFLFFNYKPLHLFILIIAVFVIYSFRVTHIVYSADTSKGFIHALFDNPIVYLPNYLTHEFGHRIWGSLAYMLLPVSDACRSGESICLASWIGTVAGNGNETLIPIIFLLLALRLKGGGLFAPPLLYWISTTVYGAAIYASDARAQTMALTSSDFLTNFKPGEAAGDWYYILKPLGLLNYDVVIGQILFIIAAFLFVMAVYSAYYYFANMEEISKREMIGKDWDKKKDPSAAVTFDNIYQGPPPDVPADEDTAGTDENKMPRL